MFGRLIRKKISSMMHSESDTSFALSGKTIQDPDINPEIDKNLTTEENVCMLLKQMTLEEKVNMLGGEESMAISGVPRLKIPRVWCSDATAGVRCFGKATTFPTPIAMAATWNRELMQNIGRSIAEECRAKGVSVLLAPGINLYRVPTCGRNFEYMGEDPFLISELVVPYIRGVQDKGVITTVKHFACNNSDYDRHRMNSQVDERALHELYLPGFKAAITKAKSYSIMCSYNPINGVYASENEKLLTDILRKEWKFNGFVISDWTCVYNTKEPILAGLDVEMPKGDYLNMQKIQPLLDSGDIKEEDIDRHVKNILRVFIETGIYSRSIKDSRYEEFNSDHSDVALKTAQEAIILLKNENSILPLSKSKIKKLVVLGKNALRTTTSGGGSCYFRTDETINIFDGLKQYIGEEIQIVPLTLSKTKISLDDESILRDADAIIYCTGFTEVEESECWDRSWKLTDSENTTITNISQINQKMVVVITAGAGLETESWIHQVPAVLHSLYLGQNVGKAICQVLFGEVNPSGKLPFTMAKKWEDFESTKNYVKKPEKVNFLRIWGPQGKKGVRKIWTANYKEGLMVGYRHFDTNQVKPQFPFGFGLSYTSFEMSNLQLSKKQINPNESISVSLDIKNIGEVSGAETVQLYIQDMESTFFRPLKELKGFEKIFLAPDELKVIHFEITEDLLQFYDDKSRNWKSELGLFKLLIGNSSQNIILEDIFELTKM
ncbi:Beta-hexosaminidase [Candidatus Lokiarchaeum ossiferum]|uniref:Beta-hexosaminidase n=1 Tax=Candidatus Lokiarchaeum ossiferum TaxID=2951803 RepID=A0ABY6HQG6_9ARCH|nr:Beta-hexosaminidase [Candidatus Lokiarchaeum sp. B-35]